MAASNALETTIFAHVRLRNICKNTPSCAKHGQRRRWQRGDGDGNNDAENHRKNDDDGIGNTYRTSGKTKTTSKGIPLHARLRLIRGAGRSTPSGPCQTRAKAATAPGNTSARRSASSAGCSRRERSEGGMVATASADLRAQGTCDGNRNGNRNAHRITAIGACGRATQHRERHGQRLSQHLKSARTYGPYSISQIGPWSANGFCPMARDNTLSPLHRKLASLDFNKRRRSRCSRVSASKRNGRQNKRAGHARVLCSCYGAPEPNPENTSQYNRVQTRLLEPPSSPRLLERGLPAE